MDKEPTNADEDRFKTIERTFPKIDGSFNTHLNRYMNRVYINTLYKVPIELLNNLPEPISKKLNIDEFQHKVEELIDKPVWNPKPKLTRISI
jgi:hypothetical protein